MSLTIKIDRRYEKPYLILGQYELASNRHTLWIEKQYVEQFLIDERRRIELAIEQLKDIETMYKEL